VDNHESDLYCEITSTSIPILAAYRPTPGSPPIITINNNKATLNYPRGCQPFKSEIDGTLWIDIPFMYDPYWEKKSVY
jgi:hypothetical protein